MKRGLLLCLFMFLIGTQYSVNAQERTVSKLIICVANNDETAPIDTLYTEDDILWFNDSTREIRFKYTDEEVREKLWSKSDRLEFRLGEDVLFKATRTSIAMSHTITDLVLCRGCMAKKPYSSNGFYLYDCYPLNEQVINNERTQANIQKRAPQWEVFLEYWEGKGKLQPNPIEPVTYIKDPTEVTHNEGAVYDLSGRKSNGLKKGLYIQNGKKVVVK